MNKDVVILYVLVKLYIDYLKNFIFIKCYKKYMLILIEYVVLCCVILVEYSQNVLVFR